MGRRPKGKKVQQTPPQDSRNGTAGRNLLQNRDLRHPRNDRPGEKYASSAGRPLQATKHSQHQRQHQETVHVNCNQRTNGRNVSRPAGQPRQASSPHYSRTDPNNNHSQVNQTRDESMNTLKGKKRRKRRPHKLKSNDEQEHSAQRQTQDKSQSNILVSNYIDPSQAAKSAIYYAIRNGAYNHYGVHTDWNVCVRYLKGAPGATFKSFTNEEEAFEFAHGDYHEVTPSPPKKKLKQEEPRQAAIVMAPDSPVPRAENRTREEVEPSREVELSTRRRGHQQRRARIEPMPDVKSPPFNGVVSRPSQPLTLNVEDDSVEEAEEIQICQTSRQTQPVPSSESSSEVQFVEDLSDQPLKVEPVLLPTKLFTSDANHAAVKPAKEVKRENRMAQTGPRKNSGSLQRV